MCSNWLAVGCRQPYTTLTKTVPPLVPVHLAVRFNLCYHSILSAPLVLAVQPSQIIVEDTRLLAAVGVGPKVGGVATVVAGVVPLNGTVVAAAVDGVKDDAAVGRVLASGRGRVEQDLRVVACD